MPSTAWFGARIGGQSPLQTGHRRSGGLAATIRPATCFQSARPGLRYTPHLLQRSPSGRWCAAALNAISPTSRTICLTELEVDLNVVLDGANQPPSIFRCRTLQVAMRNAAAQLALAAVRQGYTGLLVPSAAMQGTNLVLLPSNLPGPLPAKVVESRPLPIELINGGQEQ